MPLAQILMVSAVVPSLLMLWYFRARDAYPEPPRVVFATFALGVLTVIPVVIVGLPVLRALEAVRSPIAAGFLKAFLTAAVPEELFKYCVVVLYCARHKEFNEPMDGVVYGATASLGFATLENILYVSTGGLGVAAMRALLAVPGHAFMGAIMGYFVGQSRFRPAEKQKLLALGYLVPALLHGLYDWPLLTMQAVSASGAQPGAIELSLLLLTLVTFIFEWSWTVRIVRRLRGEQLAYAPQPSTPFTHPPGSPYALAPRWSAPPAPSPRPVLGTISLVLGALLAAVGGMITLGMIVSLFIPEAGVRGENVAGFVVGTLLFGALPLALGLAGFVFGVKKLNGK